jgi:hypothetical protein
MPASQRTPRTQPSAGGRYEGERADRDRKASDHVKDVEPGVPYRMVSLRKATVRGAETDRYSQQKGRSCQSCRRRGACSMRQDCDSIRSNSPSRARLTHYTEMIVLNTMRQDWNRQYMVMAERHTTRILVPIFSLDATYISKWRNS